MYARHSDYRYLIYTAPHSEGVPGVEGYTSLTMFTIDPHTGDMFTAGHVTSEGVTYFKNGAVSQHNPN